MIKVVVADDNKILLEQIVNAIKKSNKLDIVGIANNGEEELEYIKCFFPDVVITDIEMPKKTGVEVIEIVQNFEKVPEFIVITGGASGDIMKKLYSLSIRNILYKPVDMTKLIEELESIGKIEKEQEIIENKQTEEKTFFQKIKKLLKK